VHCNGQRVFYGRITDMRFVLQVLGRQADADKAVKQATLTKRKCQGALDAVRQQLGSKKTALEAFEAMVGAYAARIVVADFVKPHTDCRRNQSSRRRCRKCKTK